MKLAIGLGASLGPRIYRLTLTLRQLDATPGLSLVRCSKWVKTPPLTGGSARGWFANGVALFHSSLEPYAVLDRCRELEEAAGRRRARFWGDRPLDLDLIHLEDLYLDDPVLTLPHPALLDRPFVLEPLLEVWPDAIDPRTGVPYRDAPTAPGPRPFPIGLAPRPRAGYASRRHCRKDPVGDGA